MNWTDEPATEQQLSCLRQFGCIPNQQIKKSEAADLIRSYRERERNRLIAIEEGVSERTREEAYRLRLAAEEAKRAAATAPGGQGSLLELASPRARRQEFWQDTCQEPRQMHIASVQVLELYQRYGCRFSPPTQAQVQEILDALDSAMPYWDREHPELFYQTLELNFPELVRLS